MNHVPSLLGTYWMIRRDAHRSMLATAMAIPPEGWQAKSRASSADDSDDGSGGYQVKDGVAIISVYGPIYRHSSPINDFMSYLFGGISVDAISRYLRSAVADPDVRSILFRFDSPGGEAAGIAELAGKIRAASAVKPIAAYAESSCCSAAYYLAAACLEITAAPMSLVGSVGTVIPLVDDSKFQEMIGVIDAPIVSEQSPRKWPDITTEEGRNEYQLIANALSAVFIADVARYRGVDVPTVLANYGQGACLVGDSARKAGMVDKIGTLDDVLRKLSGPNRARLAQSTQSASASLPLPSPIRASLQPIARGRA